jgi:tRNA threonylcarbamoyladenosine biosynthesis protein TsaE
MGRGVGSVDRVTSPTFTLVNEYRGGRLVLYHVDLYRIVDAKTALTFGLDEYLYGDGVCAIEWAERVAELWPDDYLRITLRHIDDMKRGVTLRGFGTQYEQMVRRLKHMAFGV